ncbi:MAG: response regulator [candidate division Zixibacteria bacterium]|nr:response regulator [candidate division Zixibacteria bacterium]
MKTILLVDDEEHILKLYQKVFSDDGFQVKLAQSGEQATLMAKEGDIDLVILDIKMEGISGLETLAELRKSKRNMPIILNSAYSTYKSDFQSWLADAYLVKSANVDELRLKVHELLEVKVPVER